MKGEIKKSEIELGKNRFGYVTTDARQENSEAANNHRGSLRKVTTTQRYPARVLIQLLATAAIVDVSFGIGVTVSVKGLGMVIGSWEKTSWTNRSIFAFRGIPYAKAPIGDLRFQPPVKVESWNGTILGTKFGNVCPQNSAIDSPISGNNEDCLTLNVYVPEVAVTTPQLPVIIWIHGGSFINGYAAMYQPHYILEEDVILVVPQFRLGPLGLLSLQTDEIPGNVQFLDQIMAMQWVQHNIGYFDGDASRVTLAGHSSGAASVNLHQLSPLSTGLFHRAVIMSASAFASWALDREPLKAAMNIASFVGCNQTNLRELTACYKVIPVQTLLDGFDAYQDTFARDRITDANGGRAVIQSAGSQRFLEEDPAILIAESRYSRMPMMGGVAKHDGSCIFSTFYRLFVKPHGLEKNTTFLRRNVTKLLMNYLGETDRTGAFGHILESAHYDEDDVGDFMKMAPGMIDISSVLTFKAPTLSMMRANSISSPSYLYTFNYFGEHAKSQQARDIPFPTGIGHAEDLVYLFPRQSISESDMATAKRQVKFFASFAANGKPTADGVTWNPMSTQMGPYLKIESEISERENFLDEYTISRRKGLTPVASAAVRHDSKLMLIGLLVACLLLIVTG